MRKIRILRARGGLKVGQIMEVRNGMAKSLIGQGVAVEVVPPREDTAPTPSPAPEDPPPATPDDDEDISSDDINIW